MSCRRKSENGWKVLWFNAAMELGPVVSVGWWQIA
jgi:hypothetical protein